MDNAEVKETSRMKIIPVFLSFFSNSNEIDEEEIEKSEEYKEILKEEKKLGLTKHIEDLEKQTQEYMQEAGKATKKTIVKKQNTNTIKSSVVSKENDKNIEENNQEKSR